MFGVAEFHDGHYEEVDVVDCKKDSICFITSDGTRYKYEENRRFLFQKYRPDYIDWVFTDNIRRVMMTVTDDGKHELRGYLKKGEKEMEGTTRKTKKELLEEIAELKKEVERVDQRKQFDDAASALRTQYDSLIDVGFGEADAMTILVTLIQASGGIKR